MNEKVIIMAIFVGFALIEILAGKFLQKGQSTSKDAIIEIIATSVILLFTVPTIISLSGMFGHWVAPQWHNIWQGWSWPLMFLAFVIGDDLLQYWWHRACHSPFLYGLHRAHHSANYMSVRVVYRNNLFYYMIMPSLWMSGFLIYLGLFDVYPYYLVIKLSIIIAAHSSLAWDRLLLSHPLLKPVLWILARVISTPSTHHAHHGMHADDGVTNYKGNFGNMLFLWDMIFGTAYISGKYPKDYGIEDLQEASWQQELLWPLVSKVPNRRIVKE